MFHGSTGAETKLSKRKKTKKWTASPVVTTVCTSAETTLKADACFSWLLLQLDARRSWQLTKADGKKIFAMEGPVPFFHLYRHFQWVQWFQNNNNRGQAGCGPSGAASTTVLGGVRSNGAKVKQKLCVVICSRMSVTNSSEVPQWTVCIHWSYQCSFCLHLGVWFKSTMKSIN